MEFKGEAEALDAVVARLRAEFVDVDEAAIRGLVTEINATLSGGATVKVFLPLLVHRAARSRLSSTKP